MSSTELMEIDTKRLYTMDHEQLKTYALAATGAMFDPEMSLGDIGKLRTRRITAEQIFIKDRLKTSREKKVAKP
jgi:hypothetical protein